MGHRVDRVPRYSTEFIDAYSGPYGELLVDSDMDELVLQNEKRGGVRLASKASLEEIFSAFNKTLADLGLDTKNSLAEIFSKIATLATQSVNVLDYGAKRDGKTDDSPAIQAAIDYASKNGQTLVVFPAGNYAMASKVVAKKGLYLIGLGRVELHRISHNYGTMITFMPDDNAPDGDFLWQGPQHCGVVNIIFQYHGNTLDVPYAEGGGVPLTFGLAQDVIVSNCVFYNRVGPHTIEISGCKNVVVKDCKFLGAREFNDGGFHRESLQIEQSSTGGAVSQSSVPNAYSPSQNVVVDNCFFGPSSAFPTGPACVGNHTAQNREFPLINLKVVNCTFDSPEFTAVNVYSSKNFVVDNCTFLNCPRCVYFMRRVPTSGSEDGDIAEVDNWGLGTNGLFFTNNFVEASEGNYYTFQTRGETDADYRNINVIIANNTFRQRNGTGHIFLRYCTNALVQGNVFRGPCKLCLSSGRGNVIFKNNLCQEYTENGVWIDERDVPDNLIGKYNVIDGNVFDGHFTNAAGRSVNFYGTSACVGATITNNVIRGYYTQNTTYHPIHVNSYDYVVIANNTLYRINDYNLTWPIYKLEDVTHSSIGDNYVL